MASKQPPPPTASTTQRQTLLSASLSGAKFLILLQVTSRLLTFIVNQILLRFLSPELLGISVQLELFMISVLFFSRESLRTALQRQPAEVSEVPGKKKEKQKKDNGGLLEEGTTAAQSQTVVNLSLLTVPLGVVFASVLALFYTNTSTGSSAPYFRASIGLYVVATLLELLAEPCFALAQQKMLYRLRAGAESAAAATRCVVTCAVTVYAARRVEGGLGALPFAVGQVGYAAVLLGVYWWRCWRIARESGFSMGLRGIRASPATYTRSLFHRPLANLAISMWIQAFVKHLLTHLDSLLIAVLTTPHDQGIYALAANYGSLLARMLFQPIEEASRNLFAKLLSTTSSSSSPSPENTKTASTILTTLLKCYLLFSLLLLSLAPPFAPTLLQLLLGPRWGGEAGDVLAAYCYYIPLLAVNGVTEAFVQSVASERELAGQSVWMGVFSAVFAGAGWVLMGVMGWGARGLVGANVLGMVGRVVWSGAFIGGYFKRVGEGKEEVWGWGGVLPSAGCVAAAVGVGAVARGVVGTGGVVRELVMGGALGVGLVLVVAVAERRFFKECWGMVSAARAK